MKNSKRKPMLLLYHENPQPDEKDRHAFYNQKLKFNEGV